MFVGKLGTFVALGVRESGMIENRSFNLVEFYVKMDKTNRNLRRSCMKKIVCTMLCIMLLFGLSACGGDVSEVKTHNVESESYSEEDIKAAIDTIKKEFKSDWKGCTLTEIYYAGDDCTKDHKDWADRNNADEVIVLLSSFDVDSSGGDGSLNPNSTYSDWKWILVRTDGGKWQHVDHGY